MVVTDLKNICIHGWNVNENIFTLIYKYMYNLEIPYMIDPQLFTLVEVNGGGNFYLYGDTFKFIN